LNTLYYSEATAVWLNSYASLIQNDTSININVITLANNSHTSESVIIYAASYYVYVFM